MQDQNFKIVVSYYMQSIFTFVLEFFLDLILHMYLLSF
jgi:hypothetical protein